MKNQEIELTAKQIQRLAQDAIILTAAACIFVPASEKRVLAAVARVQKLFKFGPAGR